jgi:hypothetical protein
MIPVTRPVHVPPQGHPHVHVTEGAGRPLPGGAPAIAVPLPVASASGQQPYAGMDPSNPATWVRQFAPQPGMIAFLNFNGAAVQGRTPTGGVQRGRAQRRRGYARG